MMKRCIGIFFGLFMIAGSSLYAERMLIIGGEDSAVAAEKRVKEAENFIKKHPELEKDAAKFKVRSRKAYGIWLVEIAPLPAGEKGRRIILAFSSRFPSLMVLHEKSEKSVTTEEKREKHVFLAAAKKSASVSRSNIEKAKTVVSAKKSTAAKKEKRFFMSGKEMQWLSLLAMAMIGLILVMRSSRQVARIRELQKKLEEDQKRLQTEIEKGAKL